MQRFILSVLSVVLATAAVAPTAQALPKVDPDFEIQTLRLREFDARNKGEDYPQPYYPEASPQNVTAEQESSQKTEATVWVAPESQEESPSPALSVTERRHQLLDRS